MNFLIRSQVRRLCSRSALCYADYCEYPGVKNTEGQKTHVPFLREINSEIKELVRSGRLQDARKLFDEMPQRDEASWTNVISGYVSASDYAEAFRLFSRVWADPCLKMDPFIVSVVLKACGLDNNPTLGQLLHGVSVKNGLVNSVFVGSSLLDMYAKTGKMVESCQFFDEMPERNVVSWTAIITGLVKAGYCKNALVYFSDMWCSGLPCDAHSFAIALKACSDSCDLEHGREIHTQAIKRGFDATSYVANTLATMYNKCGKLDYGMCLFSRMKIPDVVSWTSLITTYVQTGKEQIAVQQFVQMRQSEVKPNEFTFAAVISACAILSKLLWGQQLQALVTRLGFIAALSVANSVMSMYSRCSDLKSASLVFSAMTVKDIVSWSSIIAGYSQAGHAKETFEYLSQMRISGPNPTEFALSSVLSVAGSMALLEQGRSVHGYVLKTGLDSKSLVQSALINMYSKCGGIKEAEEIYSHTDNSDIVSWTSMVNGYAEHGHSHEAIGLFEKMLQLGLRPDSVTFIGVLSACSHAGLVDLGHQYFNSMTQDFGISPSKQHYGCMIDLLCRAGKLAEAEKMIDSMPCEKDDVVWSTLLRACRVYGDVERGKRAAERVLECNPNCAGTLTTLANIYSMRGKWREAANTRKVMRLKGVVKEPGSSWIKVKDEVYSFVSGDKRHPDGERIYSVLDLLASRLDVSVQDGDAVLYDM